MSEEQAGPVERRTWPDVAQAVKDWREGREVDHPEAIARYAAVPAARGGAALDVGCGAGQGLFMLAERGYRPVVGVDKFTGPIAKPPNAVVWRIDVVIWAAMRTYELITMCHVLEHVKGPALLLRMATRWVDPEGQLYVAGPLKPNDNNPYHMHAWNRKEMRQLIGVDWQILVEPCELNTRTHYAALCRRRA